MGHDVHGSAGALVDLLDETESVLTDGGAHRDVFVGDGICDLSGFGDPLVAVFDTDQFAELALNGPGEIDGGRSARFKHRSGAAKVLIAGGAMEVPGFECCQIHAVSGGDSDASRATHHHVFDSHGHLIGGPQRHLFILEGQETLFDREDRSRVVRIDPDGTGRSLHGWAHRGTAATKRCFLLDSVKEKISATRSTRPLTTSCQ